MHSVYYQFILPLDWSLCPCTSIFCVRFLVVVTFEGVCFCFKQWIGLWQPNSCLASWCSDLNMCNILSATSWHCVYGTSWMSWGLHSTVIIMTLQASSLIGKQFTLYWCSFHYLNVKMVCTQLKCSIFTWGRSIMSTNFIFEPLSG